jgi:hypothetical protein
METLFTLPSLVDNRCDSVGSVNGVACRHGIPQLQEVDNEVLRSVCIFSVEKIYVDFTAFVYCTQN